MLCRCFHGYNFLTYLPLTLQAKHEKLLKTYSAIVNDMHTGDVIEPTILVIIGITGDLSKRKLLPAITKIMQAGVAPQTLHIVGVSRQDIDVTELLADTPDGALLTQNMEMYQLNLHVQAEYVAFAKHLDTLESKLGGKAQRLIYMSVPPQMSYPIIDNLGQAGLGTLPSTKLLLEKPFGVDLASATELVAHARRYFSESQLYRIDHYLAKEMAQNLIVFRQSNALFNRTWNKDFIAGIDIIASETIGIEGRDTFYEQTGALRDVVQSHLLQLAALTLADLPEPDNWQAVPEARRAALAALKAPSDIARQVVRGQYNTYRSEVHNPKSLVETFVALTLESTNPRWQGVPIRLITGKALDLRTTEIRVRYRQNDTREANELVLRIQPEEGIEVDLWGKQPGYDRKLEKFPLRLTYSDHAATMPEAYERVLLDAMRGDRSLFTTSDEVLESWRIVDPVQAAWQLSAESPVIYKAGQPPAY
jgi:glucose-6-phosphate 1-dehydrogenase